MGSAGGGVAGCWERAGSGSFLGFFSPFSLPIANFKTINLPGKLSTSRKLTSPTPCARPPSARMEFCPGASSPSTSRRAAAGSASLAAIGVLSHEPRLRLRNAVRATWLPDLPHTVAARFVLRGLALQEPNTTQAEAARHGDVLFVRARALMLRENGPLQSLVLWLECARWRFASARFIGKADDDVWIRPSAWAALLGAVLAHVPPKAHAYVGAMEAFHWRLDADAPVDWSPYPFSKGCTRKGGSADGKVGPFAFGKGATFFMTTHTAARVVGRAAHVRRITEADI